jgi:hypothetical protein
LAQKDIFYYDFLLVVQWLAMALVKEDKEEDEAGFS